MEKYKRHLQIVGATFGVFVLVGFASIFAANDDSKYKINVGNHQVRLMPVSEWGFSSDDMNFCGPTSSSSWQIRKIGFLEINTRL
jgi:hypothetical protein